MKRREVDTQRHHTRRNPIKQAKLAKMAPEKRKPEGDGTDISHDVPENKKSKIQPGEPLAQDIGAPTFTPQEFDIEKVEGLDWYV